MKVEVPGLRYALIVDDHPLVNRGIAEFIKSQDVLNEVYSASSADEGFEVVQKLGPPALAVVDFWLAEGSSIAFIMRLRTSCPDTPVLVISADGDAKVVAKVHEIGAQGFVDKQAASELFGKAVFALLAGKTWFPSVGRASTRPQGSHNMPITTTELGMSVRQGEILQLILLGLPNKTIAGILSLSESTVKEHITIVLRKLGAKNRVEAITLLNGRKLVIE
jgi:DNA-binding NarL/FixJ family response regulator